MTDALSQNQKGVRATNSNPLKSRYSGRRADAEAIQPAKASDKIL